MTTTDTIAVIAKDLAVGEAHALVGTLGAALPPEAISSARVDTAGEGRVDLRFRMTTEHYAGLPGVDPVANTLAVPFRDGPVRLAVEPDTGLFNVADPDPVPASEPEPEADEPGMPWEVRAYTGEADMAGYMVEAREGTVLVGGPGDDVEAAQLRSVEAIDGLVARLLAARAWLAGGEGA